MLKVSLETIHLNTSSPDIKVVCDHTVKSIWNHATKLCYHPKVTRHIFKPVCVNLNSTTGKCTPMQVL